MSVFVFDNYHFDRATGEAKFSYHFDDGHAFEERVQLAVGEGYDVDVFERALFLAFVLIGTSYYKAFPGTEVRFATHQIDEWQADFLNNVYQEGLSQFAFENGLTRSDLAQFTATASVAPPAVYSGSGVISLQSGGKDSLLVATLLQQKGIDFSSLYISSSDHYPKVIDSIGQPVRLIQRHIDREALKQAAAAGGKNGHVPVTFIVLAISLLQAVLDGKNTVLAAIGHEGDEPHDWIGDLPVNHQWSKTWQAEQLFAEYVQRYISPNIQVGSPLRQYSELKVAQLFAQEAWPTYGRTFSSCNVANYQQGADNTRLTWCGRCPKCANSYLLFAPFIEKAELDEVIGKDLFAKSELAETFKGLLGIDGVMKPFECVGETDELRAAYHMALNRDYEPLPFTVPQSNFDYERGYPSQDAVAVV